MNISDSIIESITELEEFYFFFTSGQRREYMVNFLLIQCSTLSI